MRLSTGIGCTGFFLSLTAFAYAADPTAPGPYTVSTATYDHGNTAYHCPPTAPDCDIPDSDVIGEVYYPDALSQGPFPLVVFLHGRHDSCVDPVTGASSWSTWHQGCDSPTVPIPSYRGYDYIGKVLASHGFIVASISGNAINGQDEAWPTPSANNGIVARAYLIEEHLRLWNEFNTSGSTFATDPAILKTGLIGKVDMQHIGTMGHSRGGDGVATHYALFHATSPYKVRAVLPIAPTNFLGHVLPGTDLGVLLGYCDGDVDTLEGSLFFDRSRYVDPGDESTKYTFLSLGSNHNFFNSVWTPECWASPSPCWADARGIMPDGTVDDSGTFEPFCTAGGPSSGRLTATQQRAVGLAYVAGFFRTYLGGEKDLLPFLRGDEAAPAPINTNELLAAYLPGVSRRRDLNRFNVDDEMAHTTLVGDGLSRGDVTPNDLPVYLRCGFDQADPCFGNSAREVHLTNFSNLDPGLSRARIRWNGPLDSLENKLPPGTGDLRVYNALQFRVGTDYLDTTNPSPTAFSVILTDGTNTASVVTTTAQLGNNELYFPPGTWTATTIMNTMRIPLSAFAGVNLADVRSVFFQYDQAPTGTILVSDLAFVKDESTGAACEASQSFVVAQSASVTTPDGSPAVNSLGTGQTLIGRSAHVDGIRSVGPVDVDGAAQVHGDIVSQGAVDVDLTATVTGAVKRYGTVALPSLPTLPAFPPPTATIPPVNPGPPVPLAPGSYGSTIVNSGGRLVLSSGDYYFTDFAINSASSTVVVTNGTRVYVQNTMAFRGPFVSSGGVVTPITLGYAGTADLRMEARFDGTFIAPNAHVFFGVGSGVAYSGSFYAKILEVNANSSLSCTAGAPTPPTNLCTDGIRDGLESDIDCGGGTCPKCAVGKNCGSNDDCVTNICSGGKCQAATSCTVDTAFDLGAPGTSSTVPADGCVRVRNGYPWWWGASRTMKLETASPGNYPVPFTWSNSCSGGSGSETYTADWQAKYFSSINAACATVIDLQGSAGGQITLRYWAN